VKSVSGRSRASQAASVASTSVCSSSASASPSAFIIAQPAPCASVGGIACAESPTIATRPADHRSSFVVSYTSYRPDAPIASIAGASSGKAAVHTRGSTGIAEAAASSAAAIIAMYSALSPHGV